MLFPRFSLRLILGAVTALCLFFVVLSMAARGHDWAIAFAIAGATVSIMAVVYFVLFAAAWVLSLPMSGRRAKVESPFAADRLPPVLVTPPPDPEN
ncbi:MAG: hypothetical protein KY475_27085 [Planctomycetes bacterium]|nr:hypothetical protein [Planctomycetota bacterium]